MSVYLRPEIINTILHLWLHVMGFYAPLHSKRSAHTWCHNQPTSSHEETQAAAIQIWVTVVVMFVHKTKCSCPFRKAPADSPLNWFMKVCLLHWTVPFLFLSSIIHVGIFLAIACGLFSTSRCAAASVMHVFAVTFLHDQVTCFCRGREKGQS